jgi:hypothetical protein
MEQMPVFVKLEAKELQELLVSLKSKLAEVKATLDLIHSLSQEEASKISEWKSNFGLASNKIGDISTHMLEPERIQ